MGLLSWVIFGLIAGLVARMLMPGDDPKGCLVTVCLGIAGGAIGGWVGTQLGLGTVRGFDFRSFFLAVIGSMLLLLGYRALRGSPPKA